MSNGNGQNVCNRTITLDRTTCLEQHWCELPAGHGGSHECECGKEWDDEDCDDE